MIDKTAYKKAARLMENGRAIFACHALTDILCSGFTGDYCDELRMFEDVFQPEINDAEQFATWGNKGTDWLSAPERDVFKPMSEMGQTRRIIALELMYYILKDEGY